MIATQYPHISLKPNGRPIITENGIVVDLIVEQVVRDGAEPACLAADYEALTLAQIHSALAYYYDHQPEMNRLMAEDELLIAEARKTGNATAALRRRLGQGS